MATKSPLKAQPLRQAGQSIDERIQTLLDEEVTVPFMYAAFIILMAAFEWLRWWQNSPPQPWLWTLMAALIVGWALRKFFRLKKKIARMRLGLNGERVVGEFLERLRSQGFHVFHDLLGEGFNVDHVVIGEAGVYVIETKTYSKPEKGEAKIVFNGKTLKQNGRDIGDGILVQARAEAHWLQQLLIEAVGVKVPVRSVVVFPGWFVETVGEGKASDVWVLNPKALPTYLANRGAVITQDQLKTLVFNLSRHIRAA